MTPPRGLKCPSARPEMEGAQLLGVLEPEGTRRRMAYVAGRVPVTDTLLEAARPFPPTAVMRFAAPCAGSECRHFEGGTCRLAARVADRMNPAVTHLPACAIRRDCRWFAQEGDRACLRCPQIATDNPRPDAELRAVALGEAPGD